MSQRAEVRNGLIFQGNVGLGERGGKEGAEQGEEAGRRGRITTGFEHDVRKFDPCRVELWRAL